MVLVIPVTVLAFAKDTAPVKAGLASGALSLSAVCVAPDMGLVASVVLSTLPRPTIALVIPVTVPVKVGVFLENLRFYSDLDGVHP